MTLDIEGVVSHTERQEHVMALNKYIIERDIPEVGTLERQLWLP